MNTFQSNLYYKTQITNDLYLKLNYSNVFEVPKIKKINLIINNFSKNKKNILLYLTILNLISSQKSNIILSKTKKIKKINVSLNKHNQYKFLTNYIIFNLPLLKNLKKINKNYFSSGNFYYYISNKNIFFNNNFSVLAIVLLYLKKNINISIKTTTNNNLISKLLLNYILIP